MLHHYMFSLSVQCSAVENDALFNLILTAGTRGARISGATYGACDSFEFTLLRLYNVLIHAMRLETPFSRVQNES